MEIPTWLIPVAITLVIWAAAVSWPLPPRQGDYDFGKEIAGMVHLVIAIIATLTLWLVYFIAV